MRISWDQAKNGNANKKINAQWFEPIQGFILSAFMKNVDILNWSWYAREKSLNKSCSALWMNNFAVCLCGEEQIKQQQKISHYPLSMEFLDDTLLFLLIFFRCCCWWISNKATYCFRSHRYSSNPILRISPDCIFVDLFKL